MPGLSVSTVATDSIGSEFFSPCAWTTHEPLHSTWWNLSWTCSLTTTRNPGNLKVKGHRTPFSDCSPLH